MNVLEGHCQHGCTCQWHLRSLQGLPSILLATASLGYSARNIVSVGGTCSRTTRTTIIATSTSKSSSLLRVAHNLSSTT